MKNNLLWTALLICLCQFANAQDTPVVSCGQKEVTDRFLRENPIAKRLHDQIEFQIADYTRKVKSGQLPAQRTNAVVTLPVVVHIIHNNGPENISDATAMAAIQHLNEAFANTGFYDPANGVNTQIQFCLAQRDPSGNATNGITRNVSPYTVMSGSYTSDDQHVKNLNRWNPNCYINIWLVREIPGGVAGYAYLPGAHGSNLDGIVMEAAYFGSSHANDVVIIHEMGHYLGLYHTFEGACNNDDCTTDGDRICDTPPDQSTGWASCSSTVNSCSTDPLSGFASDVNDLKEDYMDYGNFNCMKVFTQGQADRMNWIIQNVRKSLLNCNSCLSPCPAPVTANFTASGSSVPYGTTVNFTNNSVNASGYRWYVNGVLQSTATNYSYTFNAGGTFIIRLVALPGSPLCDSVAIQQAVNVICTAPVTAGFTLSASNVLVGTTVNFTNNSVNANSYRWYINGVLQSTTTNYSNTFNTGGLYIVRLVAMSNSPICDSAVVLDTIRVNCGITANFSPLNVSYNSVQNITFINSSTGGPTGFEWFVNGTLQGIGVNLTHLFNTSGSYAIKLRAIGPACTDSLTGTVVIDLPVIEDSCTERKNFTLTLGNLGTDKGYDVITTPDGGHLIAGTSNGNSGSNTDGLIVKIDSRAKIEWVKAYGAAGPDAFHRIIPTRDGNYVAVGQGLFKTGSILEVFVLKINPAGNVIWAKSFGAGTINGEVGRSIVETEDGGFALAADYNTSLTTVQPLYLKLDQNGNLVWSKLLSVSTSGQASDIIAQGNMLIGTGVVVNSVSGSTLNDGYIIKLRSSDGAILWTRNIESGGLSTRLEHLEQKNNELVFTMYNAASWTTTNCTPVIFKTDTSGNITYARQYSFDNVNRDNLVLAAAVTPDNGQVMTISDGTSNSSPRIARIGPDGSVQWVRNYRSFVSHTISRIKSDSKGYLAVGTANPGWGSDDLLLIKTNTSGFSNCGTTTSRGNDAVAGVTSTPAGANYWSNVSSGNIQMFNAVPNVLSHMFSWSLWCIDSANCTAPTDTVCRYTTFQKTYTAPGTWHARYIHTTKDGGSVVAGVTTPGGIWDEDRPEMDAFVMKLEADGSLQWSKRIGGNNYDDLRRIKQTSDGGYIAIGSTSSFSVNRGIYLVRLDATGNLLWSKNYSANAANSDLGLDVIQTSDGGFVFTATNNAAIPQAHGIVAKTDAAGNMSWHKRLNRSDGVDIHSVLEDADTLVVGADYFVSAENKYHGAIIKMLKTNGDILSSISFSPEADSRGAFATRLHKVPGGFMAGVHLILGNTYLIQQQGVIRFTQNLEFVNGQRIDLIDGGYWADMTPSQNGGYIVSQGKFSGGNAHILYKMDNSGEIDWQKRYGSQAGLDIFTQIAANAREYDDGTIIAASTYTAYPATSEGKIHVIKTNPRGETPGCLYGDFYDRKHNMVVRTSPISWTHSIFSFNQNTAVTSTVNDVSMIVTERCDPPCAVDTVSGTDSVCSLNDTATYELKRMGVCTQPVEWSIDAGFATIVHTTDSTIKLKFLKTGTVTLYARLSRTCDILQDSISISVFDSPDTLNLGPDVQVCKISTWPLNARSGFKSYLWQDGSTDSTFTATEPGTYHVTVTDFCGNQLRDTVIVSQAPDVPFDLGPDIAICDKDTVTITAPVGFSFYYWSPGYRISNSYNRSIKAYPDRDTTYTVVAEKSPGCLVTDTIRVLVRRPTPLDLGADTMFCRKDSMLLDAGSGFSSYLWSNNMTTQQIYVSTGGNYHVAATDINSCESRDTIGVVMNEIPDAYLGPDTLLCRNSFIYFQPRVANALYFYLWQDGSVQPHYYADRPGTYWVEVTSRENCKARDTVEIRGYSEPPSDFLADTIGVCDGEPIELRANGDFIRYRWDNAINTASIMVDRPGLHYLEVTDPNGCTGLDSIRVYAKNCVKQIFFPNSFTPNNDGRHDIWKPIVRGRLAKFHLVIYNRWGGKVYETSDASRGWNGMINQLQQSTNTFIWACTYRFIGDDQVEHKEKGMLTLIR